MSSVMLAIDLPFPIELVWDWTTDLRNINAISWPLLHFRYDQSMPPWYNPHFELPTQSLLLGVPVGFTDVRVTAWQRHQQFVDEGWQGAERLWQHTHHYRPLAGGTRYTDQLVFDRGLSGPLGRAVLALVLRYRQRNLARMITLDY